MYNTVTTLLWLAFTGECRERLRPRLLRETNDAFSAHRKTDTIPNDAFYSLCFVPDYSDFG